jgi:hypothetical protein
MRHYLFLSVPHAIAKYVDRRYDASELDSGWHEWRARITADAMRLPSESELRPFVGDDSLDSSNPRMKHYIAQWTQPGDVARRG